MSFRMSDWRPPPRQGCVKSPANLQLQSTELNWGCDACGVDPPSSKNPP
jgi:hypothetical protein